MLDPVKYATILLDSMFQISLSQMQPPDLISESLRRARRLPQLRRGEPRALVALFGARADGRHE